MLNLFPGVLPELPVLGDPGWCMSFICLQLCFYAQMCWVWGAKSKMWIKGKSSLWLVFDAKAISTILMFAGLSCWFESLLGPFQGLRFSPTAQTCMFNQFYILLKADMCMVVWVVCLWSYDGTTPVLPLTFCWGYAIHPHPDPNHDKLSKCTVLYIQVLYCHNYAF